MVASSSLSSTMPTKKPATRKQAHHKKRERPCINCLDLKRKCTGGTPCRYCIRTNSFCCPIPHRQLSRSTPSAREKRRATSPNIIYRAVSASQYSISEENDRTNDNNPHLFTKPRPVGFLDMLDEKEDDSLRQGAPIGLFSLLTPRLREKLATSTDRQSPKPNTTTSHLSSFLSQWKDLRSRYPVLPESILKHLLLLEEGNFHAVERELHSRGWTCAKEDLCEFPDETHLLLSTSYYWGGWKDTYGPELIQQRNGSFLTICVQESCSKAQYELVVVRDGKLVTFSMSTPRVPLYLYESLNLSNPYRRHSDLRLEDLVPVL